MTEVAGLCVILYGTCTRVCESVYLLVRAGVSVLRGEGSGGEGGDRNEALRIGRA